MVVAAPTTPLPALSKPDKLRLTLYFARGQSTEALAQTLLELHQNHQAANPTNPRAPIPEPLITENTALASLLPDPHAGLGTRDSALLSPSPCHPVTPSPCHPPPDAYDLAAWTLSPEIASHIAYRRAELAERRKQTALAELDTILADAASSPIEKRRAATTMLRMLTRSNSPSPRQGGWEPGPQQPPFPSSPTGGGPALRGGGGSVSTPSTHAPSRNTPPTSTPAHDLVSSTPSSHLCSSVPSVASSSSSSSHLRPSASSAASSPDLAPSGPSVASSPVPSPSLSPEQVITHITRALEHPENPAHLATLESFLSPNATLNEEPALPKPDEEPATNPTPAETHTQLITVQTPDSPATFQVTLTRPTSGPHRNCWLIQSLDPAADTS